MVGTYSGTHSPPRGSGDPTCDPGMEPLKPVSAMVHPASYLLQWVH
jgi:hypothetical protein